MERALKPLPPQLPATTEEFLAERKVKATKTLNDQVEEIHNRLYHDDEYRKYLYAVWDEQAEEGSLSCDNNVAAHMVRESARASGTVEVGRQKLATIIKCLNIVLRRYGKSRKERRMMVGGEIVPDNGGGD